MFESPVLPMIAFCATVFGIFYLRITSQHRQRMAMVEKGMAFEDLHAKRRSSTAFAFGLLGVGIGAGLGLGWALDLVLHSAQAGDNPMPYFICVFLCGGAALIHYHRTMERTKA